VLDSLTPVEAGKESDITFGATEGATEVAHRYFVPIASIGAAVDALTRSQLDGLLRGETTDWAAVGGIAGPAEPAAVVSPADPSALAVLQVWMGNTSERAATFGSYDDLRTAMTLGSGYIGLVPVSEVRPGQMAIAVDGIDPVRGRGDLAAWPYTEKVWVRAETSRGREALDALVAALTAPPPTVTTIVASGDILQSRCALTQIRATGDWGAALRGPVGEYLAAADLALGSLDGSIQDINPPYGCVDITNLSSPPETMEALTLAGFDEMTVATNHVFDCGIDYCANRAFLETLDFLHGAGMKTVGGGKNLEEAFAPAIFEVHGVRIGILGFDDISAEDLQATDTEPGTAPLDDSYDDEKASIPHEPAFFQSADKLGVTRLQERVRQLKTQVDFVIVQIQSGTEDTHIPSPRSIKALRAAADAGADLVVGNQAHWVQSIEWRPNSFVAYALGNFIFDQTHTPEHTQGYLLEATLHGKQFVAVRFVPYQIEDKYRPVFAQGGLRTKIIGDVIAASRQLPGLP
jgi:poly-gamma-glutamate synthesis protein (capsule biosynthesis protein)